MITAPARDKKERFKDQPHRYGLDADAVVEHPVHDDDRHREQGQRDRDNAGSSLHLMNYYKCCIIYSLFDYYRLDENYWLGCSARSSGSRRLAFER